MSQLDEKITRIRVITGVGYFQATDTLTLFHNNDDAAIEFLQRSGTAVFGRPEHTEEETLQDLISEIQTKYHTTEESAT